MIKRSMWFLLAFFIIAGSSIWFLNHSNSEADKEPVNTPSQTVNTIAPVQQQELPKWDSPQCARAQEEIQEIRDSNTSGYSLMAIPNVGTLIEPCVEFNDTSVPPISAWSYENCDEAFEYGAANIRAGEEGYASHLDRDNDGIACER